MIVAEGCPSPPTTPDHSLLQIENIEKKIISVFAIGILDYKFYFGDYNMVEIYVLLLHVCWCYTVITEW